MDPKVEHCINVGESTNLLTYASMLYLTLKRTRALFCTETMAWNARQMDMVEDETLYQNVILRQNVHNPLVSLIVLQCVVSHQSKCEV